jgi:hypothetical protein
MMLINKIACLPLLLVAVCAAQNTLPPLPAPLGVPAPGPSTDGPYAPQPILPGGIVMTLYPPGSPFLNMEKIRQAEQYNMSQSVPGRISSIVNIHNPSIEVHTVDRGLNTGAAVILVPGGAHCPPTVRPGGEFTENRTLRTFVRIAVIRPSGFKRIRKHETTHGYPSTVCLVAPVIMAHGHAGPRVRIN